jgi:predicted DNA-binding ribbon-helix-helix protein
LSPSRLVNRNVIAGRGRTSMRLEPEMWGALTEICARESVPLASLVQRVEAQGHPGGRTSAVRVFVLEYFRAAATEEGHARAGHGLAKHPDDGAPRLGQRAGETA